MPRTEAEGYRTFDIPFDKLPGGRMNAKGELDPKSSPEDAHKGAFVAAKKLGLFRNFEWVHWMPTAESTKKIPPPASGAAAIWTASRPAGAPRASASRATACTGDAATRPTPPAPA